MSMGQQLRQPKTLSRGIDYLGDLGAKLRDLQGDRTLAYELIQNADDAPTATSMCFEVTSEALVVDNDGTFSDCGVVEESECPWKQAPGYGYRCDFHRIRKIASGDKRTEPGTTGAFGIGFITVYQVTDSPEIISAGRHWKLHEERLPDDRIEVCPGCALCDKATLPGTRLVLPWARGSSILRRALQLEPVSEQRPSRILEQLLQSVPSALLFLRRIRSIEIKANGRRRRLFQCLNEGNRLILSDGGRQNDQVWHLIRGDFFEGASALRARHLTQIEHKRSPDVSIAIPGHWLPSGLLCASLPTEHDIPLPLYINADFFPSNDRKHVLLADDYQSEWNREALRAAARAVANHVGDLTNSLGPQHFWDFLRTVKDTADLANRGGTEPTLSQFWKTIEPRLKATPIAYTNAGKWTIPSEAYFPLQKEEASAIPVLERLGLNIVHEDLRPHQNLLIAESVGVSLLDIPTICEALKSQGLDRPTVISRLPDALKEPDQRANLWAQISRLLERLQRTPRLRSEAHQLLRTTAIAPGQHSLWPCGEIFYADAATVALFESLDLDIPFVEGEPAFAPLTHLCKPFDAEAAVDVLASKIDKLQNAWIAGRLPLARIFSWFEDRRQQILANNAAKEKLARLPIFPSAGRLCALEDVALPGDFDDPLGLAQLIDLASLGGRREFLRDLGVPRLDFLTYATTHLPGSLNQPNVPNEKRRAAVILLAEQAGKLKDQGRAIAALRDTALVECEDGNFRCPGECYFSNPLVRDCLRDVSYAVLPRIHQQSVHDLYAMLGVSENPRMDDVLKEINRLSREARSEAATRRIERLLGYLFKWLEQGDSATQLTSLRTTAWLPARGRADRWYRPTELYASYQKELFESQALFLDIPIELQQSASQLLKVLGVNLAPSVDLVARHLKHCATHAIPVHNTVYRFLNDKAGDPAINSLRESKCLWLDAVYKSPEQVFWTEHRFGKYRWRLTEDLRSYHKLLTQLEVRESPDADDALSVLKEISKEFARTNRPLDGEARAVLMACWQLLEEALQQRPVFAEKIKELRSLKCVANEESILNPPEWMFFENRAGLAEKFEGFLSKNVIARPLGAAHVLQTAGVRSLGSAVEIELLECDDPVEDREMMDRLHQRRGEIGRVLESQSSGPETMTALAQLENIKCRAAAALVLRFRLRAFNRELTSHPEDVPALYEAQRQTLLHSKSAGHVPWSAIARELSIALFPDEDPGRFAPGLKEALAPESAAEAGKTLDELGFARLDTSTQEAPPAAQAAGQLGTEQTSSGEEFGPPPPLGTGILSPEEAVKQILGPNAPPPTPGISDTTPEAQGSLRGSPSKATSKKLKERPVLRSYIPSPNGTAHESPEGQGAQGRSPVDIAGVSRVMEYERSVGRHPREMPSNNKGYDIESRDANGALLRYIEVKSFSGEWDCTYADLSRDQFDMANQEGERFWLYVVERAEKDDYHIHRIQNPAGKANHFMFDDGWQATAESDAEHPSDGAVPNAEMQSD